MRDSENRLRTVLVTYFPMFIVTLSLCIAIFNGYSDCVKSAQDIM